MNRLTKRDIAEHLHTCLREWRLDRDKAEAEALQAEADAKQPGKGYRATDYVRCFTQHYVLVRCIGDVEAFLRGTDCEHGDG